MRFDDGDLDWLADQVAAVAAAEIMPRFRRLEGEGIRQKTSAADLVTDADIAAESALTAALADRYPGALIVGEEACEADASALDRLAAAPLAFVVDPVDGTFNFASGAPLFGVLLAVVEHGETVAGLIHDPVTRSFTLAVRGGGAFFQAEDGARSKALVAPAAPVARMIGSVSWQYFPEPERSTLAANQARTLSGIGYRCAAHEYRLLASGGMHFAIFNKLMPWDHLAGVLIHAEAGGYSAHLDGAPYRAGRLTGGLLCAPDRESWTELRRELFAQSQSATPKPSSPDPASLSAAGTGGPFPRPPP